ncbi:MAG: hypothetical protein H6Q14_1001 [Bacteroidetes bacterium]|nr:hypothetical protein [Bacteroidota bacterium]
MKIDSQLMEVSKQIIFIYIKKWLNTETTLKIIDMYDMGNFF